MLRVTLASIGDAVITTDTRGTITYLNTVAEQVTGWSQDAVGQPLERVFRIVNEDTRQPVDSPAVKALRDGDDRRSGESHPPDPARRQRAGDR